MSNRVRTAISAEEILHIAQDHAHCANYLLQQENESLQASSPSLLPIITLLYTAIELTLKAYIVHEKGRLYRYKNLLELLNANEFLELSRQEADLLKTLQQQQAFRKGIDYELWDNEQQLLVFCHQILDLFITIDKQKPLELCEEYLGPRSVSSL